MPLFSLNYALLVLKALFIQTKFDGYMSSYAPPGIYKPKRRKKDKMLTWDCHPEGYLNRNGLSA